jgi:protein-S-isoprenylcysteine O-methyltransferase Ste14
MSTQTHITTTATDTIALKRSLVASYALSAYAIGMSGAFWVLLAAGGFAPHGLTEWQVADPISAVLVNFLLALAFATQHTIMARSWFKEAVKTVIPQPIERSTYVLAAGIAMAALVYFWQTVPGVTWIFQAPWAVVAIRGLYLIGIGYFVASTLVTNHFELFGLRQAWLYCTGQKYTPVKFKQNFMYRYSRHPMMLGLLLAFWSSPEMSSTRFVLATLMTAYIFVGIQFEERSLVKEFGDKYRQYQEEIGLFFTLKK